MKSTIAFRSPKGLCEAVKELIDKGATDVCLELGDFHIPVKPKDKIAIDIMLQLVENPEIETVGDVIEVLQDAIMWHQLLYLFKQSDTMNAKEKEKKVT